MRGKTEGASLVLTPAETWWVGGPLLHSACFSQTDGGWVLMPGRTP